jgi:tRNA pseudouridine38-40 synthase
MTVAYDGTDFHGWQVQPQLPTIQGILQEILSGIEGFPVLVEGSGRTDAGVHAVGQVAAFDLENPIPCPNLQKAVNRLLPSSIRVTETADVDLRFHPRHDAKSKTYEYRVFRGAVCSPFLRRYVMFHPYPMDWNRFAAAATVFVGEHDFSAFTASDERDATGFSKVRTVFSAEVVEDGDLVFFQISGSGFLKHMVRNLVGTMIEAGRGNLTVDQVREVLASRDRRRAGPTAAPEGLFLMKVEY